jgi:hypothetical protein
LEPQLDQDKVLPVWSVIVTNELLNVV